jgi:hypothetical protein
MILDGDTATLRLHGVSSSNAGRVLHHVYGYGKHSR